jgi:phospholipid-translocating ATPase
MTDLSSGSSASGREKKQEEKPQADSDSTDTPDPLKAKAVKAKVHFHDVDLEHDIQQSLHVEPGGPDAAHARLLNGFFSVLALCHTVLTSVDPHTGVIEYKAQSPDEAALVQAAADMGFVFRGRDSREVMLLQTPYSSAAPSSSSPPPTASSDPEKKGSSSTSPPPEALERYELLNVLEFSSARKRMSVVVRKMDSDDQRLFLMTKGADNVIFERLKKGTGDELKKQTEKALDDFASEGLRTLTLAYKVISGVYSSS